MKGQIDGSSICAFQIDNQDIQILAFKECNSVNYSDLNALKFGLACITGPLDLSIKTSNTYIKKMLEKNDDGEWKTTTKTYMSEVNSIRGGLTFLEEQGGSWRISKLDDENFSKAIKNAVDKVKQKIETDATV